MTKKLIASFVFSLIFMLIGYTQSAFNGFNYQAVLKNGSNQPLVNQPVDLKIELRKGSESGLLWYDETHSISTNVNGYIGMAVGEGIAGGNGLYPLFESIDWQDTSYFCNLFLWDTVLNQYELISSKQIFSVPFALYSRKTAQPFYLSNLVDVDTASIIAGSVLKWDGIKWVIAQDQFSTTDTVAFAYNSGFAVFADTANYALNAQNITPADTAWWTVFADSANYSMVTDYAIYADTAGFASTAGLANFASGTWSTTGNAGTNPSVDFIGTTDSADLVIKTDDTTRLTVKANGRIGIGTSSPAADLHIAGNNGLLLQGNFGTGTLPYQGAGTRLMWYPKKAAFRGGTLDAIYSGYWDDFRIGNYSFSYGKNTRAEGQFSLSMGYLCHALGDYSAAIGAGCFAYSPYSFSAGHSSETSGEAAVALGRGNRAGGLGSVALGYHSEAQGDYSTSFGFYTFAYGNNSVTMGYQSVANHNGSFIYNDFSNVTGYLNTTADNQFMAKAAGGFVFYTDAAASTGVSLAPGSGSWANLSDSTKKENFELVNCTDILEKVRKINLYTWNYKAQPASIRHIGPTAQEFSRVFGMGENNTTINTVDMDGVNMAAIKALAEKSILLDKKTIELEEALNQVRQLKKEREEFKKQLDDLEKIILNQQDSGSSAVNNN